MGTRKKVYFSLSKKIFILILAILVVTIVPLFYIAQTALSRFGSYAYTVNKDQLKTLVYRDLPKIADEIGQKHNEIFKRIRTSSAILANHIMSVYDNADMLSQKPLGKTGLVWNPTNQMFLSPKQEDVITAYWGDRTIPDDIQMELNALSHLKPVLIKSKDLIKESMAVHIITISGIGCYYTADVKAKKACYDLPPPSEFDLRDGEPVTLFTKNDEKLYETQWTSVYKDDVIDGLMITATTPIYDQAGRLRGVTGIDIPVQHIGESLVGDGFFSETESNNSAFAFLQDENGNLIAFPKRFLSLFGLNIDFSLFDHSDDIFNYRLKDSSFESVRKMGSNLQDGRYGVMELMISDEKYLVAVSHLKSVNWRLVMVVKEAFVMSSVQKTALALKKSHIGIRQDIILYSSMILFLSVILILYAVKILIKPVKKFIETVQKVEKGDFSHNLEVNSSDEIGILSKSLNSMMQELTHARKLEQEYAKKLDFKVKLRTMEFEAANQELSIMKRRLEKIVDQKTIELKKMNEHLMIAGEQERKSVAADLHDGVAQTLAFTVSKIKSMKESDRLKDQENLIMVKELLETSVAEIRAIIYQLRPPIIDDFEIDIALGYLIDGYNQNHDCRIDFTNKGKDFLNTPQELKLALYRCTNELIINALKHAKTNEIKVELLNTEDSILLTVEDTGIGFDVNQINLSNLNAFGLYSLSERINNLGGTFDLSSTPGKGTRVQIRLPFDQKQDY